jgi:iron-sulfur cluster repair protein YtfE (RIC family)
MSTYTETRTEARKRRAAFAGEVDFTMMYVAHDAFNRDLARLIIAADAGEALSPAAIATWKSFSKQLHTHHTAEDQALWPFLVAAVTHPDERRITQEMEAEHASLDLPVEQIAAAIAHKNAVALAAELKTLARGLPAHMIHEEAEALPLVERHLGQPGWDAFGKEIRDHLGGIKGASEYLPWVLEGASEPVQAKVLHMLPAPARLLYRRRWAPNYSKSVRLG